MKMLKCIKKISTLTIVVLLLFTLPSFASDSDIWKDGINKGSITNIILHDKTSLFDMIRHLDAYTYEISSNLYKVSDVNTEFINNPNEPIETIHALIKSKYTPASSVVIKQDKPKTPTGLTATAISSSEIHIQWDKVSDSDGYHLCVSIDNITWYYFLDSNKNKRLFSWVSGFSEGVTDVTPGQNVYFKVASVKNGVESDFSNVVSTYTKPIAPTGLTAILASSNSINVQWNQVANIDGYYICLSNDGINWFYKTDANNNKVLYQWNSGSIITTSNVLPGTTVYYKVSSVKNGVESDFSNVASATTNIPYFQKLSDVPIPNGYTIHHSDFSSDGKIVRYYFTDMNLIDYFILLKKCGFEYIENTADNSTYFKKNGYALSVGAVPGYYVISGFIH